MKPLKSFSALLATISIVLASFSTPALADKAFDAKISTNVPACLDKTSPVQCAGSIEAVPFESMFHFVNKTHFDEFKKQNHLGYFVTPKSKMKPYFAYKIVNYKEVVASGL